MIYLLTRQKIINFSYTMYHYGPYSNEVSRELSFAENIGIVDSEWDTDSGRFLSATNVFDTFQRFITDTEKQAIDGLVVRYGDLSAKELSIIATAFYLKDRFGTPDEQIIEKVHNLKDKFSEDEIRDILIRAGVIVPT
jgi:uncharacterized protein YwgA